jgi:N-acyl-L-homoserine lactone synthetase
MALVIRPHHRGQFAVLLDQMYRLRRRVFVDRLGWELDAPGGREIDRFDQGECRHLLTLDRQGRVLATVRLTPSTEPNVTCEVLQARFGVEAPRRQGLVELSRECVDPDLGRDERRAALEDLRASVFELFAREGWSGAIGVVYEPVVQKWIRSGARVRPLAGPCRWPGDSADTYLIQWTVDSLRADMPWRKLSGGQSRLQDPQTDPELALRFGQPQAA